MVVTDFDRRRVPPRTRLAALMPAMVCFAVAMTLAVARVASERVYNDEQLFLGGAGLTARGGGLMYRDFFYTHVPTHALVLAGLFPFTAHWTLAARLLDGACGATLATVLFEAARRAFVDAGRAWRVLLAAATALIFLFNPVTADALGKAWNHDFAAMTFVVGLVLLAHGLSRPRPTRWAIAAGACAALSATARLTFAPPLIAFPLLVWLAPGFDARARWRLLAWMTLGGVVAALPAIVVCLGAPQAAYFDNVMYPGLTKRYYREIFGDSRATLATKVDYVLSMVTRSKNRSRSLQVIVAMTIATSALACRPWRARTSLAQARLTAVAGAGAAAFAAMFVPSPIYHQYLFGPLPFAVLLIAWGAAAAGVGRRWWSATAFVGLAVACVASAAADYDGLAMLTSPASWPVNQSHRDGRRLAQLVGTAPGKVLTFLPGVALEAKLPIYPELSVGRFATRSADFLTAGQRRDFHVPNADDMRGWFASDPPSAVLMGKPMSELEASIVALARAHGYVERADFSATRTLYLPATRPTVP